MPSPRRRQLEEQVRAVQQRLTAVLVHPLRSEAKKARALGFVMLMHVDRRRCHITIRLKSETERAKQACRIASGSQLDSIEVSAPYSAVVDNFWEVAESCVQSALERARDALA